MIGRTAYSAMPGISTPTPFRVWKTRSLMGMRTAATAKPAAATMAMAVGTAQSGRNESRLVPLAAAYRVSATGM